jgi:hypothetical protein
MKVVLSQHDYIRGGSEDIHPFPTFKSGGTMFFHPPHYLANNLETAEIRAGKQKFYVNHEI